MTRAEIEEAIKDAAERGYPCHEPCCVYDCDIARAALAALTHLDRLAALEPMESVAIGYGEDEQRCFFCGARNTEVRTLRKVIDGGGYITEYRVHHEPDCIWLTAQPTTKDAGPHG